MKIEFGTRFDWLIADRNSQKKKIPDFLSSRFFNFLSIFARNLFLRNYASRNDGRNSPTALFDG